MENSTEYYAFDGENLLVKGSLLQVALGLKSQLNQKDNSSALLFDGSNGRQLDIDLQGSEQDIRLRYEVEGDDTENNAETTQPKPRGRPKLGVVGREVTLLPRHWQWLDTQRGGASAALRRLIEQERKATAGEEQIRSAQDSANRFMYAMAGDLQGFEEAVRALYARDKTRFELETEKWPVDIRSCARKFAELALI